MLPCLVPVLFAFYLQDALKFKCKIPVLKLKSCHCHKVQNFLSLNFDKTYFLQFWIKNSQKLDLTTTLLNMHIINTTDIKLVGSTIDETLSWMCRINHIRSRLSTACYAMRTVTPLMAVETSRMTCFSYAHSVITCGMILGVECTAK